MARLPTTVDGRLISMPDVIRRYLAGEKIRALAKECGRSRMQLYRWMFMEVGAERYEEIKNECLVARIAEADEAVEAAKTPAEVTKAVAQAKFARFDYERRAPGLYGPKQDVGGGVVVQVQIGVALREPGE